MSYGRRAPSWVYKNQMASQSASYQQEIRRLSQKIEKLQKENDELKKKIEELKYELSGVKI